MKQNLSYFITRHGSEISELKNLIGSYEEIENVFGIEFACGIEDGVPIFLSDIADTNDDPRLKLYDGLVVEHIFRREDEVVYDAHAKGCRFVVTYDEEHRVSGNNAFSNAKILNRGIK